MDVRIDCYYAVLEKFKIDFPDARFELIMRKDFNHCLSPSWKLINLKKGWERYVETFIKEIKGNATAMNHLNELKRTAEKETVFLVCFEKDPTHCHRRIVKWLMGLERNVEDIPLDELLEMARKQLLKKIGINKYF